MKLFLDENLSPWVAKALRDEGIDAVHVRDRGLLSAPDRKVWGKACEEDRIVVTSNVGDFETLASNADLHSGAIFLEGQLTRDGQLKALRKAAALIEKEGDLLNRVLEISEDGKHRFRKLAKG